MVQPPTLGSGYTRMSARTGQEIVITMKFGRPTIAPVLTGDKDVLCIVSTKTNDKMDRITTVVAEQPGDSTITATTLASPAMGIELGVTVHVTRSVHSSP